MVVYPRPLRVTTPPASRALFSDTAASADQNPTTRPGHLLRDVRYTTRIDRDHLDSSRSLQTIRFPARQPDSTNYAIMKPRRFYVVRHHRSFTDHLLAYKTQIYLMRDCRWIGSLRYNFNSNFEILLKKAWSKNFNIKFTSSNEILMDRIYNLFMCFLKRKCLFWHRMHKKICLANLELLWNKNFINYSWYISFCLANVFIYFCLHIFANFYLPRFCVDLRENSW